MPDELANGPRPHSDSASAGQAAARHTNSARALALGPLLLGRDDVLSGIWDDLARIGLPRSLARRSTRDERYASLVESNALLTDLGVASQILETEQNGWQAANGASDMPRFPNQREQLWSRLSDLGSRRAPEASLAYAWLRLLMAENDPLLVVSASSVLSRWRRPPRSAEASVHPAQVAARNNIALLASSSEALTSDMALASVGKARELPVRQASSQPSKLEGPTSLIVHGTFAYTKGWWRQSGDFHDYLTREVCPHVYSGDDPFDWSGGLLPKSRRLAAEGLAGWLHAREDPKVEYAFAHSYGASVTLQSTMFGAEYDTVVLLSAPVDTIEIEWRRIRRAVSLRIHLDLILLAAFKKQKFTSNVEEYWLDGWFTGHSATHDPSTWSDQDVPETLGIHCELP